MAGGKGWGSEISHDDDCSQLCYSNYGLKIPYGRKHIITEG